MDRQDILEQLKRTESDVKARIDAAEKHAAEIRDHAAKQAKTILHEGEQKAAQDAAKQLTDAKAAFTKERQRALATASADADAIRSKAQVKKAEEFFLKKFNESLHV